MKQPLWSRRRRGHGEDGQGDGDADGAGAPPDRERGEQDVRARLRDLEQPSSPPTPSGDGDGDDRQAAYAAWAERMRSHKQDKLADLAPPEEEPAGSPTSPYWDTSFVFAPPESDRPDDPTLMDTRDLLAVFGLAEGTTARDLTAAFRRLAKQHHPDRWYDAPSEVQAEHEATMARIVESHHELKKRGYA